MKKMFAECMTFTEGSITKKMILLVCGQSLNPLSVHVLNEGMTKPSTLRGKKKLSVSDWDSMRYDNPGNSVVELDNFQIQQVLRANTQKQFSPRVMPRHDIQSKIAVRIS